MSSRGPLFARLIGIFSLSVLLCAWLCINVLGDRTWWALPILFGPRWVWLAVLPGMIPWAISRPRLGIPAAFLALGLVMFGILDFRIGVGILRSPNGIPFRVLEFNAEGGGAKTQAVIGYILQEKPDLLVIAECSPELLGALHQLVGYDVRESHSVCLGSVGTIESWEPGADTTVWKVGGPGTFSRAVVRYPNFKIQIGAVHLATPRHALDSYFDLSRIPTLGPMTKENTTAREKESTQARHWIVRDSIMPTIVAGDFNTPIESAIFKESWGDFTNALSTTGIGLVHTKKTHWWGIRIDHVLMRGGVQAVQSWVGPDLGSDHLPVIAELVLPKQ